MGDSPRGLQVRTTSSECVQSVPVGKDEAHCVRRVSLPAGARTQAELSPGFVKGSKGSL